jgi:hypothetical protein
MQSSSDFDPLADCEFETHWTHCPLSEYVFSPHKLIPSSPSQPYPGGHGLHSLSPTITPSHPSETSIHVPFADFVPGLHCTSFPSSHPYPSGHSTHTRSDVLVHSLTIIFLSHAPLHPVHCTAPPPDHSFSPHAVFVPLAHQKPGSHGQQSVGSVPVQFRSMYSPGGHWVHKSNSTEADICIGKNGAFI